jgi:hypothetical protein
MGDFKVLRLLFLLYAPAYLSYSCTHVTNDQNGFSIGQLFSADEEKPLDLTVDFDALQKKAREALSFVQEKDMYHKRLLLIDMARHSGLKRFFVWNTESDTIEASYLVSHGCCDLPWGSDRSKNNPIFSNVPDSHCSSLGKYKIGERGYSNWGVNTKYFMHGLDSTNNNAYSRVIVFHSWEIVPDEEIYPKGTPEGWGCPAISNNAFREIDKWLKEVKQPVLMWVYQ